VAEAVVTPENAFLAGGMALLPPVGAAVAGGVFSYEMINSLIKQYPELEKDAEHAGATGNWDNFKQRATEMGLTGIMAYGATKHTGKSALQAAGQAYPAYRSGIRQIAEKYEVRKNTPGPEADEWLPFDPLEAKKSEGANWSRPPGSSSRVEQNPEQNRAAYFGDERRAMPRTSVTSVADVELSTRETAGIGDRMLTKTPREEVNRRSHEQTEASYRGDYPAAGTLEQKYMTVIDAKNAYERAGENDASTEGIRYYKILDAYKNDPATASQRKNFDELARQHGFYPGGDPNAVNEHRMAQVMGPKAIDTTLAKGRETAGVMDALQRHELRQKTARDFKGEEGFIRPFAKPPEGTPSVGSRVRSQIGDYGLAKLEDVAPDIADAFARVVGSRNEANVMLRRVMPSIMEELPHGDWNSFSSALIESGLRGRKQLYRSLQQEVAQVPAIQLEQRFAKGDKLGTPDERASYSKLANAVSDRLANKANAAGDTGSAEVWRQVPKLLKESHEAGNYEQVRRVLGYVFSEAEKGVSSIKPDFEQYIQTPEFQRALPKYKELIETPLRQAHELAGEPLSKFQGPLDTYYPFSAKENPNIPHKVGRASSRALYGKAFNPYAQFRTGLGEYEPSVGALHSAAARSLRASNLNTALTMLGKHKDIIELGPNDHPPAGYVAVPAGNAAHIIKGGERVSFTPGKQLAIPEWMHEQLEPILKNQQNPLDPATAKGLANAVTRIALIGPLDAVFHYSNVMSGLTTNVPVIGKGLVGKTLGATPLTKVFVSMARAFTEDVSSPAAMAKLEFLARNGMLPSRYASTTYSQKIADITGAKKATLNPIEKIRKGGDVELGLGAALYGPKGIDVRARLVMLDAINKMNPKATIPEIREFVNRMGNYQYQLESRLSRMVKRTGFAPFYTAGSSMIRNGLAAWGMGGRVPMKAGPRAAAYTVAQQLSGGAAGLVTAWALTYKAYHDKWPWEDKNSRLLQIPLKDEHEEMLRAKVGDKELTLFGKRGKKNKGPAYISFLAFNPAVGRGPGAMIRGAYETGMAGGTPNQGLERANKEAINTLMHPVAGPPVSAAMAFGFGVKPYLTQTMENGQFSPKLMSVEHGKKTAPGLPSLGKRFVYGATGMVQPAEMVFEIREREDRTIARTLADLVYPRFVAGRYDVRKTEKKLKREQKMINKIDEWEPLKMFGAEAQ
jgi:hypothetical protein